MAGVAVTEGYGPQIDTETVTVDGEVRQRQVIRAADYRPLAERMFARAPQPGYAMWLDLGDVNYMYFAEAPVADAGAATTFQGIRVPLDLAGNIVGKVQTAVGFAWDSRKDGVATTWT